MQCIICLIEDDDVITLQCISSNSCKFQAHPSCICQWHKVINKYECPICHFILPNEATNNSNINEEIESINDNPDNNQESVRVPIRAPIHQPNNDIIYINNDESPFERVSRINQRIELLNSRTRVVVRNNIVGDQRVDDINSSAMRKEQKQVICLCSAIIILCLIVACVIFP